MNIMYICSDTLPPPVLTSLCPHVPMFSSPQSLRPCVLMSQCPSGLESSHPRVVTNFILYLDCHTSLSCDLVMCTAALIFSPLSTHIVLLMTRLDSPLLFPLCLTHMDLQ